jgi:hypothetical protein
MGSGYAPPARCARGHPPCLSFLWTSRPGTADTGLRLAQALNCEKSHHGGRALLCVPHLQTDRSDAAPRPERDPILDGDNLPKEGGILKVDQIREFQRTLNLKPYQSNIVW